jgi:mono/diheme cytochrome c family protein
MPELIGRFHPLLVHLPIGILLIASVFYFLSAREKYASLKSAVTISLFLGILSAIASCISGYILSNSDDYDASMISKHQWFGIGTAVVSIVAYYSAKKNNKQLKWVMLLMVLLILITGHLGGSITHGSDYLTKGFSSGGNSNGQVKRKPIADVQNAVVYTDMIQPILEARCYGCHGPNKQKGKLRLDEPGHILKGGEDGKIIIAGKPGESDLIERLLLSKDDDDHMPPKEKPQLSKQDIDLLHWWVSNGADFNKKVNEFTQTEKIKPVLLALQTGGIVSDNNLSDIPVKEVSKADEKIIAKLKEKGVAVSQVAINSNYLSVNFVAVDSMTANDLDLLQSIKKQLVWLKLGNSTISDKDLSSLPKLSSLTRLYLERTAITDKGIEQLKTLTELQYLNLSGTKITAAGLEKLKELKKLKQIYLYQTTIKGNEWTQLIQNFPDTKIDTGGYIVPLLASDTVELKEAIKKNK